MSLLSIIKEKGIVFLIIILSFYVAIAIYSDINEFGDNIKKLNLVYIIPIILCISVSVSLKGVRQYIFLKQIDIRIPFFSNLIIYLAGLSMLISPGGSGEIIKSHYLKKKYGFSISRTIPVVLVERYHDAVAVFTYIVLFSVIAFTVKFTVPLVLIAILLVLGPIVVKKRVIIEKLQKLFSKIKILKFIGEGSEEFNNSLTSLSSKKTSLYGWGISLFAWVFDALAIYFSINAFNQNFDFFSATLMGFSATLFGAISFIPGGLGVTEVSMVQLLSFEGLDIALATAITIFWRICTIWYSTIIGIIATKFALK